MGYIIEFAGKIKCGTRHVRWQLLLALMLALGLFGERKCYCLDTQKEEIELLRFLADGYEANLDQLRSWKGTAIMRKGKSPAQPLDGKMPLSFKEDTAEQLRFIADRDKDAVLWYGTVAGEKKRNSEGNRLQSSPVKSGMNKGELHYRMDAISEPQLDPRSKRRLLIYSKDALSHGFENLEFDPLWVLIEDIGAHGTMGDALRMWAETLEKKMPPPEGAGYSIERKGDVVTFKSWQLDDEIGGGATFSSSYVFDISKGCSAVGQHHVSSQSETHWKLDYEDHNGVFVPKEITNVHRNKSTGIHHHIVFTTEMVNEPVSESEFSYDALGLRPGDYIIDHVKGGLQYEWKLATEVAAGVMEGLADEGPAQLVGLPEKTSPKASHQPADELDTPPVASEPEFTTAQPAEQKATSTILFGLGIFAIVAVVAILVIAARLKAKNEEGAIS